MLVALITITFKLRLHLCKTLQGI